MSIEKKNKLKKEKEELRIVTKRVNYRRKAKNKKWIKIKEKIKEKVEKMGNRIVSGLQR